MKRKRKQPIVKVKKVGAGVYSVYVCFYYRGEKKEVRGKTEAASEKEVKARALAWVKAELKALAKARAAEVLRRRKERVETVCRALGV